MYAWYDAKEEEEKVREKSNMNREGGREGEGEDNDGKSITKEEREIEAHNEVCSDKALRVLFLMFSFSFFCSLVMLSGG